MPSITTFLSSYSKSVSVYKPRVVFFLWFMTFEITVTVGFSNFSTETPTYKHQICSVCTYYAFLLATLKKSFNLALDLKFPFTKWARKFRSFNSHHFVSFQCFCLTWLFSKNLSCTDYIIVSLSQYDSNLKSNRKGQIAIVGRLFLVTIWRVIWVAIICAELTKTSFIKKKLVKIARKWKNLKFSCDLFTVQLSAAARLRPAPPPGCLADDSVWRVSHVSQTVRWRF